MAKQSFFIISVFIIEFLALCYALETPSYNLVHSESDFEIRLYGNSSWMSAPVREVSFQKATVDGFNRYFLLVMMIDYCYHVVNVLNLKRPFFGLLYLIRIKTEYRKTKTKYGKINLVIEDKSIKILQVKR